MEIKVKVIKENKDGSADAIVHFDKEGLEFLVQEGILSILKQYIEQHKNAKAGIKLRKKLSKEFDIDGRC
jgi:phosphomannomutase